MSHLDSTVTRLRAQLERGEAIRQNHEFEMAKLNRQMAQERRRAAEREAVMANANDALRRTNCVFYLFCNREVNLL